MKGITRDCIRKICDDLGLTSSIDSDGDIRVVLSADEDFGHDVLVFFSVDEKGNWLRVMGMAVDFDASQDNLAKYMLAINNYNRRQKLFKAYMTKEGRVIIERWELMDEDVSEEFIKENCVKISLPGIWDAFKNFWEQ